MTFMIDRWFIGGGLIACMLFGATGCLQTKASAGRSTWDPAAGGQSQIASDASWSILLESFIGAGHSDSAARTMARYRMTTGLTEFWVASETSRSTVYYGKYSSENADQAKKDQARLKQLAATGQGFNPRSFIIAPVAQVQTGTPSDYDLRLAAINPQAIYTLQVAVYDDLYGEGFRRAAEQHAARLRADGENAYFYHGPRQSLVTVGVFYCGAVKVVQSGPRRGESEYHPYIRDTLQAKFPDMMVNGKKQPVDTTGTRFAPTILVRIPR